MYFLHTPQKVHSCVPAWSFLSHFPSECGSVGVLEGNEGQLGNKWTLSRGKAASVMLRSSTATGCLLSGLEAIHGRRSKSAAGDMFMVKRFMLLLLLQGDNLVHTWMFFRVVHLLSKYRFYSPSRNCFRFYIVVLKINLISTRQCFKILLRL